MRYFVFIIISLIFEYLCTFEVMIYRVNTEGKYGIAALGGPFEDRIVEGNSFPKPQDLITQGCIVFAKSSFVKF